MSKVSKAERDLCTQVLADISKYLPSHYVEPVMALAAEEDDLRYITPHLIRNVKNERQVDSNVIKLLRRVANEQKARLQSYHA